MGTFSHHAIVVTTWSKTDANAAHAKAVELGCQVSPIVISDPNALHSFCIFPDGSKEGWKHSDDGDARRDAWIEWESKHRNEDDSGALDWAEVEYGELGDRVTRSNNND